MRLALSSGAAPDAALGPLLESVARRGLPAVELVEGHGHGLDPGLIATTAAAEAARRAEAAGVALAGFRLRETPSGPDSADFGALVGFARAIRCPILVPLSDRTEAVDSAAALRRVGVDVLSVLPSGPGALGALGGLPPELALAWDADPSLGELAETGSALISRVGGRLRHIQLRGGGPEATEQAGRGVGSLMVRLAVSRYRGTVALAPSSDRYRVIWDAWLGRRGGWGCGSKAEDRGLVSPGGAP